MVEALFPIIATADLDRALTFWRDLLGGQVAYRFPPEGESEYLSIDLGRSQLGIGVERAPNPPPTVGRISLWCYVLDCDAVVERVRAAGLPIRQEPADQPWGERLATIEDPDGNRVFIGTKA